MSGPPRARAVVIALVVALVVSGLTLLIRGAAGDGEAAAPGGVTGASPTWVAPTMATGAVPATPPVSPIGPSPAPTPIASPDDRPVIPSPGDPGPAPLIQPFALLPGATPSPNPAGPPAASEPLTLDGCDRHYGAVGQCIPVTFPPGTDDRCGWLLARGYGPLPVHGEDPHDLDPDGDGTACGPGD